MGSCPLPLTGLSETHHPLTAMLTVTLCWPDSAVLLRVSRPNKTGLTQRHGFAPAAHSSLTCPQTTQSQGLSLLISSLSGMRRERRICNMSISNLQCRGTGQGWRRSDFMCTTCSLTCTPLEQTIPTVHDQINSIRPNSWPSFKKF